MKDVYNPNKEDILEWVGSKSSKWPESDWDYYVMGGDYDNDLLVYELANDNTCAQRSFFLHALYYFVGDFFNEKLRRKSTLLNLRLENKKERIGKLLDILKNDETASPELKLWFEDVNALFENKLLFDVNYWLHHLFYEDIKVNEKIKIENK